MAGMKGITVNTAPEAEPHMYAEDDAAIYQAIFGGDGVSTIGQACKATILSNNKVRVADGVICVGGHMARIPYGEYEDCEIMNGQSGKNRNDIIAAKFETTGTGGIDTMTCEVIQGTAGETATDPELTQDDTYAGGKVRECPLYRVKIEGLSIVAVEQMFDLKPTTEELKKLIDGSNKDLSNKVAELNKNITSVNSFNKNITKMIGGSKVVTAKASTSVQVLSNSEINNALGITNSSNANTVVLMTNGDGLAQKVHVEGSTYLDGAWHATFNQNASSGSIRINYVIFYFGK